MISDWQGGGEWEREEHMRYTWRKHLCTAHWWVYSVYSQCSCVLQGPAAVCLSVGGHVMSCQSVYRPSTHTLQHATLSTHTNTHTAWHEYKKKDAYLSLATSCDLGSEHLVRLKWIKGAGRSCCFKEQTPKCEYYTQCTQLLLLYNTLEIFHIYTTVMLEVQTYSRNPHNLDQ